MRVALILVFVLTACAAQGIRRSDGWERIEMNDYKGAAALFTSELEHRESADAQAGLARSLYLLGRLREADAAYAKALRLEPAAQSYIGHSLVQIALGDMESAVQSCDRALEMDPRLAKAWYDRGIAQSESGQQGDALADFSRAIELETQFADAYNARGLVLARMDRLDEALQDFRMAAQLDPLLAAARANCAVVSYSRGEAGLALKDLDAAIKIDRRQPVFYANRGRILLDRGDAEGAAREFEQAAALGDESVWPLLADARERTARAANPAPGDSRASELDPTSGIGTAHAASASRND